MPGNKTIRFTNRKHPKRGIMSTVLGIISSVSLGLTIFLSYRLKGATIPRYGTTTLLTVIMSVTGFALGWVSRREIDRYRFFPRLGIFLNGAVLFIIILITYIAVYGTVSFQRWW